ncbi:MAG: flagellar type III secretion system pore protein FliP [Verrucomicrobiales bacterium]|nr:flagellar type III secretion system pore protein FliP [Verrucomicrobiales bacterium]
MIGSPHIKGLSQPRPRTMLRRISVAMPVLLTFFLLLLAGGYAAAQSTAGGLPPININIGSPGQELPRGDTAVQILFLITMLSLAPSILLLMTCFTRIVIVLAFVRTALTLPTAPANQIIVGLSLFITFFVMAPVWERIDREALKPYQAQAITGEQALETASKHLRTFMLRQTRPKDVDLFIALARLGPTAAENLPLRVVIPSFIISELRTAFQMGFLLFIPFILIDLVVATVLMSMGMMMMPPNTLSLPLKILLFVLVDGWSLIVRSLVQSFGT